jgi:hypothetical protein
MKCIVSSLAIQPCPTECASPTEAIKLVERELTDDYDKDPGDPELQLQWRKGPALRFFKYTRRELIVAIKKTGHITLQLSGEAIGEIAHIYTAKKYAEQQKEIADSLAELGRGLAEAYQTEITVTHCWATPRRSNRRRKNEVLLRNRRRNLRHWRNDKYAGRHADLLP